MATVTTSNVYSAGALDQLVERTAVEQFEKFVTLMGMGDQAVLPQGYNKYNFNTIDATSNDLTAATLSEGVTPTESDFSMTQIEVSMTQLGRFVKISDLALSDSPVQPIEYAASELGRVIAEAADEYIQDQLEAGTNVIYVGQTARANITASDTMTAGILAQAGSELRSNAAPMYDGQAYVAVVHPKVAHDLKIEASANGYNFLEAYKYTQGENIFNGELGKLNGVRIVESANIRPYVDGGSTTVDVYPTYVMGQYAYGVVKSEGLSTIIKGLGSGGSDDPLDQRATVASKVRFGAKILKEDALYRIESASSIGNNT